MPTDSPAPAPTPECTPVRVLIDCKVVVEPNWTPRFDDERERLKWMESWAEELQEFFRDHRHQDVNSVSVDRVYERQCSLCHREWEEMIDEDTGKRCCANCGEEMEVVS